MSETPIINEGDTDDEAAIYAAAEAAATPKETASQRRARLLAESQRGKGRQTTYGPALTGVPASPEPPAPPEPNPLDIPPFLKPRGSSSPPPVMAPLAPMAPQPPRSDDESSLPPFLRTGASRFGPSAADALNTSLPSMPGTLAAEIAAREANPRVGGDNPADLLLGAAPLPEDDPGTPDPADVVANMPPDSIPEEKRKFHQKLGSFLKESGITYLQTLDPRGKNKILWGLGVATGAGLTIAAPHLGLGVAAARGLLTLGLNGFAFAVERGFLNQGSQIGENLAKELGFDKKDSSEIKRNATQAIRKDLKDLTLGKLTQEQFSDKLRDSINATFIDANNNQPIPDLDERVDRFMKEKKNSIVLMKGIRSVSSGMAVGSLAAFGVDKALETVGFDVDKVIGGVLKGGEKVVAMGVVPNQPPNPNIPLAREGFPFDEQTLAEKGLNEAQLRGASVGPMNPVLTPTETDVLSHTPDMQPVASGGLVIEDPLQTAAVRPPVTVSGPVDVQVITDTTKSAAFQEGLKQNFPGMSPEQAFGTNGDTVTTVGLKGAEVQHAIDQLGLVERVNPDAASQAEQALKGSLPNLDQATLDQAKAAAKVSKEQAERLANDIFGYGENLDLSDQNRKAYKLGLEALARQNAIDSVAHNPLVELDKIQVELGSEDGSALLKSFADEGMRPDIWSKTGAKFWGMLAEGVQLPDGSTHEFISKADWIDRIVTTIRSGNTEAINVFREFNILSNPDILNKLGIDAAKVTELLNQINQGGEGATEAAKSLKEIVGKLPQNESLFDKDKLHKLIVRATEGDAESLRKLHELFHFRPAGELRLPKNWKLMLGYMGDKYGPTK